MLEVHFLSLLFLGSVFFIFGLAAPKRALKGIFTSLSILAHFFVGANAFGVEQLYFYSNQTTTTTSLANVTTTIYTVSPQVYSYLYQGDFLLAYWAVAMMILGMVWLVGVAFIFEVRE